MKAYNKIFITNSLRFLLLAAIIGSVLVVGGYFYYKYSAKAIQAEKENGLKAIAGLKIDQLVQWHNERTNNAEALSFSQLFTNGVEKWLQDKSNKENEQIIAEALSLSQKEHEYENVSVFSTSGDLLLSVGSKLEKIDDTTSKMVVKAAKTDKIYYSDFYYCKVHNEIHYDIVAPIKNEKNIIIAILVFRIDPTQYIYPLIQSWPTPSKSAETLLFKKDGDSVLYLNDLRHQNNTALKLRLPLTQKDLPTAQAILGKTGIIAGKDYRGVDVISYLSPVPETEWFIAAKVDKKEIFAELYFRGIIVSIVIALLILSLTLGLIWIYQFRQKSLYKSLWQVQEEFRTTLYSIGDGVISTDLSGRVKNMNDAAEKLTGWKETDAIGKDSTIVFKIINEETRSKVENPVKKVLRGIKFVGLANHTLLISKDGTETPIADSGAPIKNEQGEIIGAVLIFRDQTEERLQQNLLEVRLKLHEFSSSHSLNEILTKTLDEVEVLTKSKIGFYHFVLPDQLTLQLQAWSTKTEKEFCKADGKGLHYNVSEAGVWTDCIHQKKPVIHNDYASLPHKKGMPEGHAQVTRELVVPILRNDKIVAVLGVGNKPDDYTEKDIEIVAFIADVAWEIAQKKLKDEEIEESNRKFYTMINNLNGVVYRCANEKDRPMEYLSNSIFSLSGYPPSDFINNKIRNYKSIIHAADQEMVWDEIQTAIKQKLPYTLEYRVHTAFGKEKWVVERGLGVFVDDKLSALEGYINDITERKLAEETLRKSEENLSVTLNSIGDGVITTDRDGLVVGMNPVAEKLCGCEQAAAAGKPLTDVFKIVNASSRETVVNPVKMVLEKGQIVGLANHTVLISKNETEYQIADSAAPIKNKEGDIIGVVLVFSDITEKYAAEMALRESEEFSRFLLQTIPFGMDIVDENGIILFQSESLKKHFSGEAIGNKCWELYRDDKTQCLDCPINESIEVGTTKVIESAPVFGGKIFEIIYTGMVFAGKKALLEIFIDITERKQAEIELTFAKEQAQKSDRLKSAFLANMSHEIRTPMNGILGFSELLKEPELTTEKQQKYISIIEKSGARMLNIINDIVDISKIEAGLMKVEMRESNINEQIEYIYTFFKPEMEAKGIQFSCKNTLSVKEANIITDREKVYAILTNLVKNAIKYTEQGTITFGYEIKGKFLEFFVKDTGMGIPKDRQDAIFERFIQADIFDKMALQGAGLGLSISKAYIEMLGGKIWVDSEEGKGSTFYFTLPYQNDLAIKNNIKKVAPVDSPENTVNNLKILIVEDDETSETLISLMVDIYSKEIITAHTGIEAILACRNNPDIDLVLLDIQMPEMDGYEAVRQIRQFNKDVIIIAQTAYGLSGDRKKTLAAGCNEYISKPINKNELFGLINKYFK
ncbi:MAG: PAS domain S-box protein [Lutibacter sp.]|nr:PAS domain S-box protein [Lutibacter sp.]